MNTEVFKRLSFCPYNNMHGLNSWVTKYRCTFIFMIGGDSFSKTNFITQASMLNARLCHA